MFEKILKEIKEFIPSLIFALLFAGIFNTFSGLTSVNGESMYPTLYTGDKLLIDRVSKMADNIDKGDIIVFDTTPDKPKKEKIFYIKRVIATEGDTVKITMGEVYVNGNKIDEPYADKENFGDEMEEIVIPNDSYFVLGDHRDNSYDSRHFGVINHNQIRGKVILQIFPSIDIKKFGSVS